MMATKKTDNGVGPLQTSGRKDRFTVRIRGLAPGLLMDRMSLERLPDEVGGQSPQFSHEETFELCRYVLDPPRDGCTYGLPASGLAAACKDAARNLAGITQVGVQQGMRIVAGPDGLFPIECSEPTLHKRVVGQKGSKKVGVAAFVAEWEATVEVVVTRAIVKPQTAIDLLQEAGDVIGMGAWRPGNRGVYGRFDVLNTEEGS